MKNQIRRFRKLKKVSKQLLFKMIKSAKKKQKIKILIQLSNKRTTKIIIIHHTIIRKPRHWSHHLQNYYIQPKKLLLLVWDRLWNLQKTITSSCKVAKKDKGILLLMVAALLVCSNGVPSFKSQRSNSRRTKPQLLPISSSIPHQTHLLEDLLVILQVQQVLLPGIPRINRQRILQEWPINLQQWLI